MPYIDVALPPGVYSNGTPRQAKGRWRQSNLIRFPYGPDIHPVGGWAQYGSSTVSGAARALLGWSETSANLRWLGIGTNTHLYVVDGFGVLSDITPSGFTAGNQDATVGSGYGSGPYDNNTPYGEPITSTQNVIPADVWQLATWGQNLVGCMAFDGKLYEWALAPATPAAQISTSPTGCTGLVVTAERFIMALNGRTIEWCDQGVETTWTASATNQAGDIQLDTVGTFQCGRRVVGATLLFSEADVWLAQYQGPPTVYGFQKIGDECGTISMGSPLAIDSRCVWMGTNNFFLYNGFIQPLDCEVADFVFSNLNWTQKSKVTSVHVPRFTEAWWFYPSASSSEIDSYVKWNYKLNVWDTGSLARTCGASATVFQFPMMVDPSGVIWEHENGWNWDGLQPYVRSGPIELGAGDQRMLVSRLIGDERNLGDSSVTFYAREFPNMTETSYGPFALSTEPVDMLFTARQVETEIMFTQNDAATSGIYRIEAKPIGKM